MERVERADPGIRWDELSVVLMDDDGIKQLNSEYLGQNHPTDVLSFRYESATVEQTRCRGEVIINVERALSEGLARGSASSELALYLAHGCDHLSGEIDSTPRSRKRMRTREIRWLKQAGRELPISDLLRRKK